MKQNDMLRVQCSETIPSKKESGIEVSDGLAIESQAQDRIQGNGGHIGEHHDRDEEASGGHTVKTLHLETQAENGRIDTEMIFRAQDMGIRG